MVSNYKMARGKKKKPRNQGYLNNHSQTNTIWGEDPIGKSRHERVREAGGRSGKNDRTEP